MGRFVVSDSPVLVTTPKPEQDNERNVCQDRDLGGCVPRKVEATSVAASHQGQTRVVKPVPVLRCGAVW